MEKTATGPGAHPTTGSDLPSSEEGQESLLLEMCDLVAKNPEAWPELRAKLTALRNADKAAKEPESQPAPIAPHPAPRMVPAPDPTRQRPSLQVPGSTPRPIPAPGTLPVSIAVLPAPGPAGESTTPSRTEAKQGLWSKVGGGPLMFAAAFHIILLIIGAFWIFQIISTPEKKVDFMPPGSGGGERSAEHKVQNKKRAQITPTTSLKRVFAEGVTSTFALPEPDDDFGQMSSLSSLGGGGLSGGLGGTGSGKGFGKGSGFGTGTGGMGTATPFGIMDPVQKTGLEGVLYDAKQSPKKEPYNITPPQMGELLRDFTGHGWNERALARKYFSAPHKLYLTQVCMPLMAAAEAPKAFQCENEIQPSRWLIIYRGTVIAPKTGKFRFVGASDDAMVVRFDRKDVFDHGFIKATAGLSRSEKDPAVKYLYPNSPHYNPKIKGYETGTEFDVRAGSSYPIEILISEIPGGFFGAVLLIQESGVEYSKTETGAPLLPLFRVEDGPPPASGSNVPPFDPQGPVWKLSGSRSRPGI